MLSFGPKGKGHTAPADGVYSVGCREAAEGAIMPHNKALRVWLILGVGRLWVMLGWSIADQLLWSIGGGRNDMDPPPVRTCFNEPE